MPAGRAARADRQLVDVEVEHVAALGVQALERLLHVEQEPGEVLEQAHVALDDEHLLRQHRVARVGLDVRGDRVAGGVAPLGDGLAREADRS